MTRALVIGEALTDIVAGRELPGGSPMNVAVALGRLGREVDFASWIGPDGRGQAIEDHLAASRVRLLEGSRAAPRTSTATVRLDADGQARYVFDLLWDFSPPPAADLAVVHTGSLATICPPGAAKVAAFVESVRAGGEAGPTVTFDPNLRPAVTRDPAAARPLIERLAAASDVVKASDEDLAHLYGGDPERAAADWAKAGPAVVVVTRGGAGAKAWCAAGVVELAARPARVVDTVGAGDTFMAGLIDGLWRQGLAGAGRRRQLRAIGLPQLEAAMDRAARAAAVTVGRAGADPPWSFELP
ncbi:MAG: carbohydrate kinase [Bifidobacteriaceae bacterium]|jgi:fructokinase|nr:carbohydrate kinase [Bifidobacteriaceae bacterium]